MSEKQDTPTDKEADADASAGKASEKDTAQGKEISLDASTDKALAPATAPEEITHADGARIVVTGCYVSGGSLFPYSRHTSPMGPETVPVAWDAVANVLVGNRFRAICAVISGAEHFFLDAFAPAGATQNDVQTIQARSWGIIKAHADNLEIDLCHYILARAPTAEVLFNKARELGAHADRAFADLNPAERASLELAVRIGPAIKGAIDAVMAEADARHPPPKIPLRSQPVAVEDTIFEQVHGAFERM